ncbi:MAG: DNA mismatch repair protein [Phylliscum demangeonii]|nr:MAG: DNA mismatch repair protein [Phylliscum demangeonii]
MEETDSPRGLKRKADQSPSLAVDIPRRIKALDQDVVNKIAAGEIIVAPVHALKELVENAVDAGSTSVDVLVKDGGLKLLQITDNGHGINRDDLPVLCERFTTSKLKAFEDLASIGTYGFRGEALASISHIAHLSVTTKTKDSNCAWRAYYANSKLVPAKPGQSAEPKPIAGRGGTQITVEDLFYNVPTRRRAFSSPSEEYAKILDLVGRYAVHCSTVSFSCKKHGDPAMGISIPASASTIDRIRHVHGGSVANELIVFKTSDARLGFTATGWTSNANYHVKRTTLLLFINHRSVESSVIKKAIEQLYSPFLPKGGHPFTYLSLEIDPVRVDVNVHPTKREVRFLNEDEIVEHLCDELRDKLAQVDTSRTFLTQTLLPGALGSHSSMASSEVGNNIAEKKTPARRPYENNLVRTDAKSRKITSMLPSEGSVPGEPSVGDIEYEYVDREPSACRLTTVKELRAEVRDKVHKELTEMFAGHAFVGIVDERRRIAAIQGGVKLYLVDYGMVCEYFYQIGLTDFGNFGVIGFAPPLNLRSLLSMAARHEKDLLTGSTKDPQDAMEIDGEAEAFDWEAAITKIEQQLISRREMLQEYFSLEISAAGDLLSLPLLMKGYTPCLAKLPRFLLRLGPYVDWLDEKECFRTFLSELANFYVPESLPPEAGVRSTPASLPEDQRPAHDDPEEDREIAVRRRQLAHALEHIMFPAFKARLVATKDLLKGVIEVANLKGLYRVFERC